MDGAKECFSQKHKAQECVQSVLDVEDLVVPGIKLPQEFLDAAVTPPFNFVMASDQVSWYHPSSYQDLLAYFYQHPHAKIVHGNTELGIETKFKNAKYPVLIYPADIAVLKRFEVHDTGIEIGAMMTLSELKQRLQGVLDACSQSYPSDFNQSDSSDLTQSNCSHPSNPIQSNHPKYRGILAILDNLQYFAGQQVRNVSSWAGNIVTASPISDLNPVLLALNTRLTLDSIDGQRHVNMSDFFIGYRKTALKKGELLKSIHVPFMCDNEFVLAFKQAKRKDDDIAIVNAGLYFRMALINNEWKVEKARLAYGGMGPTSVIAKKASKECENQVLSMSLIDRIAPFLMEVLPMFFLLLFCVISFLIYTLYRIFPYVFVFCTPSSLTYSYFIRLLFFFG